MNANKIFDVIENVVQFTSLELKRDLDLDCSRISIDQYYWIRCNVAAHSCLVGVEKPLAIELAIGIYDAPRNTLNDEEIMDALKELTNIITGRLQSAFFPNTEIGLPDLLDIEDVKGFSCQKFIASVLVKMGDMSLFVGIK